MFFPQEHRAGEYAQSDFTSMNDLKITIEGERFEHLIYHFVLPHSKWETGMICFSETFEALIAGFQRSVEELGRVPHRHRTDNLSAATHDLKDGRRAFNERYLGAMAHYGVEADRNTPGRANENGSVEQAHHRFKRAVEQALLVRLTRDFADRAAYEAFLREIFAARNKRRTGVGDDLAAMKELPPMRIEDFRRERVRVSRFSTIRAAKEQLLGSFATGGHKSRSATQCRDHRSVAGRRAHHHDGAVARSGTGQDRLPAHDLVAGSQAGGIRPLSVSRGTLSDAHVPASV